MKTENIKIWASCENCGFAWTKVEELSSIYNPVKCPKCGHDTENFDDENHNPDMKFVEVQ